MESKGQRNSQSKTGKCHKGQNMPFDATYEDKTQLYNISTSLILAKALNSFKNYLLCQLIRLKKC